jgi:HK97 family phage portal protein
MASLPIHAFKTRKESSERMGGRIETLINEAPNDSQGSFKFRQYFWQQVFTGGRGLAWIERSSPAVTGVENIWALDPTKTTIKRKGGKVTYHSEGKVYDAADVIDVSFMLRSDGIRHYGPINLASKAIQLALAMNDYGSNHFAGGGVPPLALKGPMPAGPEAVARAQRDIKASVDAAKNANEPIFPIPAGYDLVPVGIDPSKGQMVEARVFQIQEISRVYQIPPVFISELSGATFTNIEQQDLNLVKHLILHWAKAFEDELNLKIFGRFNRNGRFIKHNLDGLMRGDFKSRIEGLARGVQTAIITPNEARALEDRPALPHGDELYIQGATVPLGTNPTAEPAANDNQSSDNDNNDPQDDEANAV